MANVPTLRFPGFTEEWQKMSIGSLASKVGSGSTPKGGSAIYEDNGHPFVRSQNIGNGFLLLDDIAYISDEIHNQQKNTEIKEQDVLLNITGASIGRCAIADSRIVGGNVNQHVCIIRAASLNPAFLSNFILSHRGQKQIESFQAGGNREGLNFEQVRSIRISVPQRKEQDKISSLLELIDERIALQSKLIEDLKILKSAIVERLYNNEAPKVRLGTLIEQVSTRNRDGLINLVMSVSNKYGFIAQSEQFEERIVASEDTSNYKVIAPEIFAYNPARINVGSIAQYKGDRPCIVSPMYICFECGKQVVGGYLEHFFSTKYFHKEMEKRLEGSVRLCLSFEALCNISISLPPIEQQLKYAQVVGRISDQISIESDIQQAYQKQKSYLLSAMFI